MSCRAKKVRGRALYFSTGGHLSPLLYVGGCQAERRAGGASRPVRHSGGLRGTLAVFIAAAAAILAEKTGPGAWIVASTSRSSDPAGPRRRYRHHQGSACKPAPLAGGSLTGRLWCWPCWPPMGQKKRPMCMARSALRRRRGDRGGLARARSDQEPTPVDDYLSRKRPSEAGIALFVVAWLATRPPRCPRS